MKKKISSIIIAVILCLVGSGYLLPRVHSQTAVPKLFITWKAATYAPRDFSGKILPAANSQITASVELIDNGKPADLSNPNPKLKQTIYWYLNDNFLQGGAGLQRVTFRAPDAAGGTLDLRAEVPNYKRGIIPEPPLKTITIPIAAPEVVIEAPFPGGLFSSPTAMLAGLPYFFNVKDASQLNFFWTVNGQAPTGAENPQTLTIKVGSGAPAGSTVSVSLTVRSGNNILGAATANTTLTYNP